MMEGFLWALNLTLLIELSVALLWGIRREGLLLVVLMNVLTNPAVNLLHYAAVYLLGWPRIPVVLALELAAVVTEGFCCRGMVKRPWLFVLIANICSYGIGLLIQ